MKELSPTVYSGSAVAIGYAICENMSVNDQIIVGNWLMLLGQFITTYSSQAAIMEQKNDQPVDDSCYQDEFQKIKNAFSKIQAELDKIKPQEK